MTLHHTWLDDTVFNLLIDYYTEVQFRPYGSGATRENVLPVLRDLQLGYVSIYAKGHSGYTSFPSALRTQHTMLGQDMPAAFREMTRETDTKLVLYYSGQLDGIAGLRHPDWVMRDRQGKPMKYFDNFEPVFMAYGNCPHSGYFDEWVKVHLEELITRYDPDGFWIDGDWAGPCYCPRCVERFRAKTGYTGAVAEMDPETEEAYRQYWAEVTHEWRTRFNAYIKSLKPDCLYSAGNVSPRQEFLEPFDWRSGDWFSPNNHRLHMSISMRRYTTNGIPYDAFTCDTAFIHGWPNFRARSKPLDRMLQEGATLLANGGKWGYWTYPMPNGALVPSKMRKAKIASEFAHARRAVAHGTESARWTAILDGERYPGVLGRSNTLGAAKALIALHRSPDLLDESLLTPDMPYNLIVLPEQNALDAETVTVLEEFVQRGGKLLSTGESLASPELQRLLGVRLTQGKALDDGHVLLQNGDPAGVFAPWDKLELAEAEELYPLYLSWDQLNPETRHLLPNYPIHGMVDEENPEQAGMPAATVRRLGKGLAVHIPTVFFQTYWQYGNPDMLAWLREVLDTLQPDPFFHTDAPQCVEVALRRKSGSLLIHFVNGNPGRDISYVGSEDLWTGDVPPIGPITGRIKCDKPDKVTWEPGGDLAEAEWNDGVLTFTLPKQEIHTCLVIE